MLYIMEVFYLTSAYDCYYVILCLYHINYFYFYHEYIKYKF